MAAKSKKKPTKKEIEKAKEKEQIAKLKEHQENVKIPFVAKLVKLSMEQGREYANDGDGVMSEGLDGVLGNLQTVVKEITNEIQYAEDEEGEEQEEEEHEDFDEDDEE